MRGWAWGEGAVMVLKGNQEATSGVFLVQTWGVPVLAVFLLGSQEATYLPG